MRKKKQSIIKARKYPEGIRTKAMDISFIREILAPVYYRHEFARRYSEVMDASKAVMGVFRLSAALAEDDIGYIRRENGKYITIVDDMRKEFDEARGEGKERMREALGKYARKWRVLPFPPSSQRFFPESMGVHDELRNKANPGRKPISSDQTTLTELMAIWRSLIKYERFLMAEGMMDEPCFMPVVPLPGLKPNTGIETPVMDTDRLGRIASGRILVVLDAKEKRGVLNNHMQALLDHYEVFDDFQCGDKPRRESRINWHTFEICLQALDHEQKREQDDMVQRALDFHAIVRGGKPLNSRTKGRKVDRAFDEYRNWLRRADSYKLSYKEIGKPSAS